VSRVDTYRAELRRLERSQWAGYLRQHSGLPGPRGNIELAQALAEEADSASVDALIATDDEYLVFCGVVGLGRQLAEGAGAEVEQRLRGFAADQRWRVREAVAMALQRLGDSDASRMLGMVSEWADDDSPLVQRAAIAGVCEPRLLRTTEAAATALAICERVTTALAARPLAERRHPEVRALRKGLGYCWSVAVSADPDRGLPRFRALSRSPDQDVEWIVRENSKKSRLSRLL
jgi:hypothetical protein